MATLLHTSATLRTFSERVKEQGCQYEVIDRVIAPDDIESHECGAKSDSECAHCGKLCKTHRETGDCFGKTHELI